MLAVVDSGLGVAAIEASCFRASMRQLSEKDGLPALPKSEIAIHMPGEPPTPSREAFIAFIREELKAA
jgi:hypothetical protein